MARTQRRFEERTLETKDGKHVKYKVYFTEGRGTPAIEEGECLRLAFEAGCHSIIVSKPVQAFEDNMFYMGKQKDTFGSPIILWGKDEGKPNPNYTPKSIRFIAYASCVGPDGNYYEDCASAAPDNVEMLKNYLPEMAIKRARVRVLILAMGLKGLNADVEFVDSDKADPDAGADILAQKAERMKVIKGLFGKMNLGKTEADQETKKNLLTECGINVPHNKMAVEQLDKFIAFLKEKVPKES